MKKKKISGRLYIHTEQGMDGGYLAIIDDNYVERCPPLLGLDDNEKVWDNQVSSKTGITSNAEMYHNGSWIPVRDPILDDPLYKISSLWCGEEKGDFEADKQLMEKYNFKLYYTKEKADRLYGKENWKFIKSNSRIQLKNGKIVIMGGRPESSPQRPYLIPSPALVRVTVNWNDGTIEKQRLASTLFVEQWSNEGLNILKEDDFLRVLKPNSNEVISEGFVGKIPLKVFSHTLDYHFSQKSVNWKNYFLQGYTAEVY